MASVASAPTSEVYVGTATSFVVTAAAPPLGAASGTPIEVTVSYRGSPLPGTQFRGTSDATVATTLLTEPDVPPAPSATAKELFELSVSGTIAECVVPVCWLCWGVATVVMPDTWGFGRYEGLGAVSSAQVVYKLASSTTWSPAQTTSVADRAFELVLADLQPQSHYHVKVRAGWPSPSPDSDTPPHVSRGCSRPRAISTRAPRTLNKWRPSRCPL